MSNSEQGSIAVGTVVKLNGGDSKMTVTTSRPGYVDTMWCKDGFSMNRQMDIPISALTVVVPPKNPWAPLWIVGAFVALLFFAAVVSG